MLTPHVSMAHLNENLCTVLFLPIFRENASDTLHMHSQILASHGSAFLSGAIKVHSKTCAVLLGHTDVIKVKMAKALGLYVLHFTIQ